MSSLLNLSIEFLLLYYEHLSFLGAKISSLCIFSEDQTLVLLPQVLQEFYQEGVGNCVINLAMYVFEYYTFSYDLIDNV